MAEYAAEESNDSALRMRAIKRIMSCYVKKLGYAKSKIELKSFIAKLKKNNNFASLPGKTEYLYGQLALEVRDYASAKKYFDKAAFSKVDNILKARFILLARLQSILVRIRNDEAADAVRLLTEMQRANTLAQITEYCKEDLNSGDTHAVFLAEVDRLLDLNKMDIVWSFLEALKILFPESGRELAARCIKLAHLYEKADRWEECVDRLNAARTLAPEWDEPIIALAEAYQRKSLESKALESFEKAAVDFPGSIPAHTKLATFLITSELYGNPERAVEAAQRAIDLTARQDPVALDLLAKCYLAIGEHQKAYNTLYEANILNPTKERKDAMTEIMSRIGNADENQFRNPEEFIGEE
jgi:tetratricopeptide (TPR) repeat protein